MLQCLLRPTGHRCFWPQVHEKIREDPMPEKKERTKPDESRTWKQQKLTYDERKQRLKVRAPHARHQARL